MTSPAASMKALLALTEIGEVFRHSVIEPRSGKVIPSRHESR
jgi:hypothetical protein